MKIQLEAGSVRKTKWYEYAVRFAFGGLITALSGFLGAKFGAPVGGLFLGFPAILPASLTLVRKHEGTQGAAADDALGAVAGSIGLVVFGALVWGLATRLAAWLVLPIAALVWLGLAVLAWLLVRRIFGSHE